VKLPTRPTFILPWSIINVNCVLPASRSVVVVVRSTTVVFAATAASRSTATATATNTTFVIHLCKTSDRNKVQSS